jgi:hypothetical protein
MCKLAHPKGPT